MARNNKQSRNHESNAPSYIAYAVNDKGEDKSARPGSAICWKPSATLKTVAPPTRRSAGRRSASGLMP